MKKGAGLLRAHGAKVEEVTLPNEFWPMYEYYLEVLSGDGRVAFLPDYYKSKDELHQSLIDDVENKDKYTRKDQLKAFDEMAAMRPRLDALSSKYDAIIAPSILDEAPVDLENTGNAAFCVLCTAMHMPVVNVPGFKGENGMPIGLSVITGGYRDHYLLRVCNEVGKIFQSEGGWHK